VSIIQLKEWMCHADIDTTMKYLPFAPRAGDADLVAAFADGVLRRDRPAATSTTGSSGEQGPRARASTAGG
jgi:hypothetical protein